MKYKLKDNVRNSLKEVDGVNENLLAVATARYNAMKREDKKQEKKMINEWLTKYANGNCQFEDLPTKVKVLIEMNSNTKELEQIFGDEKEPFEKQSKTFFEKLFGF